ncbi:hypothetical protein BDR26DRAFT_866901 [Obelidium mucronatum]|nr:hypothetical protein BDR26DRAFT_866901 [Obelidium mucronatum]
MLACFSSCFHTQPSRDDHTAVPTPQGLDVTQPSLLESDKLQVPTKTQEKHKPIDIATLANPKSMTTQEIQDALGSLNGTISYEKTERYVFNSDYCPKDIQSSWIDVIAREVYKRDIIKNKGQFDHDGMRIKKWPAKKKHWEAMIRYLGTLIEERSDDEMYEQSEVLAIISYFLPRETGRQANGVSATVFVTNMVAMGILEREMGGSRIWRRKGTKHPMPLGAGILPNF